MSGVLALSIAILIMDLYTKLTSTINDVFSSQLGSVQWNTVPGQLVKVSSSPAGYTWGLNAGNRTYVCKEPCTGGWSHITPTSNKILDITTDDAKVYVLADNGSSRVIYTRAVSGTGTWTTIDAPIDSSTLVATSKDIFMNTDRGVFKCKSPCTLPSWTPTVTDVVKLDGALLDGKSSTMIATYTPPKSVTPTSASGRYAYGVMDNRAHIYKNGDWRIIPGLASYLIAHVAGEIDDVAIYATTTNGLVLRCADPCSSSKDVMRISTAGFAPSSDSKQISANAQSKKVWLLSGNTIYNRSDVIPVDVNTTVLPIDERRSNVIADLDSQYRRADAEVKVGDELAKTQRMVEQSKPRMLPEEDPRILRRKIDFIDVKKSLLLLQIACGTVFLVLLFLLILPTPLSTILSFFVGCLGAMLVVSFSTS